MVLPSNSVFQPYPPVRGKRMQANRCPSVAVLTDLCEGKLEMVQLAEVESHLEGCESCSLRLDELLRGKNLEPLRKAEALDSDLLLGGMLRLGSMGPSPLLRAPCVEGDLGRLGRYRILRKVGEGASSVVYQGVDKLLLRPVLLKVFRPGYCSGEDGKRELLEEARLVARFSNDLVAGLLDLGKDGNTSFLVFPHSNGVSLDTLLSSHAEEDKSQVQPWMCLEESLRLGLDLARALGEVHRQGLLHRDIKPANVVIHMDGEGRRHARLIDLGLACSRSARVGTPAYRAPELDSGGVHSIATDLFALGRLLEDLGRLSQKIWPASLRATCAALQDENPVFRPALPEVQQVLERALKKVKQKSLPPVAWAGLCAFAGFIFGTLVFVALFKR